MSDGREQTEAGVPADAQSWSVTPRLPDYQFVLLLGGISVLGPLATNMYLPALTDVSGSLGATTAAVQQTVAFFMFGLAGGQIIWGVLGDRIGRRGPILAGTAVFLIGSTLCATSDSAAALSSARLLQGIGASAGTVLARAIVSDCFAGNRAVAMMSWQQLIQGIAPIFSPLLGAVILTFRGWRLIFWLLAALSACLLAAVALRLPETRAASGTDEGRRHGEGTPPQPLFRHKELMLRILGGAFCAGVLSIWYNGASTLFRESFGWSLQSTAVLISLLGVLIVVATQANRRLVVRWGARGMIAGTIKASLAVLVPVLLVAIVQPAGADVIVAAGLIFATAAYGFVSANNMVEILALDRSRAGSVAAIAGVATHALGGILGLAISYLPVWGGASIIGLMIATLVAAAALIRGSERAAIKQQTEASGLAAKSSPREK